MKFLPQRFAIASFGGGGFRFGGHSHLGHLLISPSGMRAWDGANFSVLLAESDQIDLVIIGTGASMVRPAKSIFECFNKANMQFEFMNTSSAVHTYNQVLSEGRRVAAGFIAIA